MRRADRSTGNKVSTSPDGFADEHRWNLSGWQWRLGIAWVAQFLCLVGFDAVFPFIPFYIRDLGVADPDHVKMWSGALMSSTAIAMTVVSPLWGVLADRKGTKLMVLRAAIGGAITLVAMALVQSVQGFFLLRVLQGALTGFNLAFVMLVASFVPPAKVASALGMMQMGAYLAFSAGPLLGGVMADNFGYRLTFGLAAIALLAGGALVGILLPDIAIGDRTVTAARGLRDGLQAMARSRAVRRVLIIVGAIYLANTLSRPILSLFVESLVGESSLVNTSTGALYGALSFASALSAILVSRIGDRVGYQRVVIVCAAGAAIGYGLQAVSPGLTQLLIATSITGLFIGGLLPTTNAIIARSAPKGVQGTVYGLSNSISSLGRMFGPILGASVAANWGLRFTFAAAGVAFGVVTLWIVVDGRRAKQQGNLAM
jgi:DHA1 family multidrug resistance protein-like MFS transporter